MPQCLAIDPEGEQVAAGDASGRILTWHGCKAAVAKQQQSAAPSKPAVASDPGQQQQQQQGGKDTSPAQSLVCSTVHWHAHAVGALCFSADGEHLASGGLEAVLVLWRRSDGSRRYLPRLGGPISSLATNPVDDAVYLVGQADNTLRLADMGAGKVCVRVWMLGFVRVVVGGGGINEVIGNRVGSAVKAVQLTELAVEVEG